MSAATNPPSETSSPEKHTESETCAQSGESRQGSASKRAWETKNAIESKPNTADSALTTTTSRPGSAESAEELAAAKPSRSKSEDPSVKTLKSVDIEMSPRNHTISPCPEVVVENGTKTENGSAVDDKGDSKDDGCCVGFGSKIVKIFKSKSFDSKKVEELYQRYFFRLNQRFMNWLLGIFIVVCIVFLVFYFVEEHGSSEQEKAVMYLKMGVLIVYPVLFLVILFVVNKSGSSEAHLRWASYLLLAMVCSFVMLMVLTPGENKNSPSDGVWIAIFFIYMTYTMLPVRMRVSFFGGCLIPAVHLITSAFKNADEDYLWQLVSRNLLL